MRGPAFFLDSGGGIGGGRMVVESEVHSGQVGWGACTSVDWGERGEGIQLLAGFPLVIYCPD